MPCRPGGGDGGKGGHGGVKGEGLAMGEVCRCTERDSLCCQLPGGHNEARFVTRLYTTDSHSLESAVCRHSLRNYSSPVSSVCVCVCVCVCVSALVFMCACLRAYVFVCVHDL